VDALPDDADFGDLDEFLWESVDVERGRDDFAEGRISRFRDIARESVPGAEVGHLIWSDQAAEYYGETLQNLRTHFPDDLNHFEPNVQKALQSLTGATSEGITLPEMGDPSILELRVRVGRHMYRIIYDLLESKPRILSFTNNKTCYRNVRGYPKAVT
jgi:hypothetical protein